MPKADIKRDGEGAPASKAAPEAAAAKARERVEGALAMPPLPPNLQKMLDETPWAILTAVSLGARVVSSRYDYNDFLLEQAARVCARIPELAQCALAYAELYRGKPWAEEVLNEAARMARLHSGAEKTSPTLH
ncbi:hypothetical protein HZA43_03200 [Candidatus Peregrinibacteria bacterium]|nr:hypothetical protein [Candidatus Peregrinibacteria bacterium]